MDKENLKELRKKVSICKHVNSYDDISDYSNIFNMAVVKFSNGSVGNLEGHCKNLFEGKNLVQALSISKELSDYINAGLFSSKIMGKITVEETLEFLDWLRDNLKTAEVISKFSDGKYSGYHKEWKTYTKYERDLFNEVPMKENSYEI